MGSIHSSGNLGFNRKLLKRPDRFSSFFSSFFAKVSSQSNLAWVGLVSFLGLGVLGSLYMNHRDSQAQTARNALFFANQSLESELKALDEKAPSPAASSTPTKKAPKSILAKTLYQPLNVEAQFPEALKKLKNVEREFSGTAVAFEARLQLANLYYDHGHSAEAQVWYEKALQSAPRGFEKAAIRSALGYTQEALGKPTEALDSFQKALQLGDENLKGDLLLSVARNYEALQDSANARSTYEKILNELPDTEYAKSAELLKN